MSETSNVIYLRADFERAGESPRIAFIDPLDAGVAMMNAWADAYAQSVNLWVQSFQIGAFMLSQADDSWASYSWPDPDGFPRPECNKTYPVFDADLFQHLTQIPGLEDLQSGGPPVLLAQLPVGSNESESTNDLAQKRSETSRLTAQRDRNGHVVFAMTGGGNDFKIKAHNIRGDKYVLFTEENVVECGEQLAETLVLLGNFVTRYRSGGGDRRFDDLGHGGDNIITFPVEQRIVHEPV